jgi:hypothetical protein
LSYPGQERNTVDDDATPSLRPQAHGWSWPRHADATTPAYAVPPYPGVPDPVPDPYGGGPTSGPPVHVHGGQNVIVSSPGYGQYPMAGGLANERQRLFFAFFRQALKQSETTFVLSVLFMSGGAAIVLAGGVLALVRTGDSHFNYLSLVTSLAGVLITAGGGALAVHSNRARRHLTAQAGRLDTKIDDDQRLEHARLLTDQVEDPRLRDRLKAIIVMRVMGINPDPETAANRILPQHATTDPTADRGAGSGPA